MKGDSIRSWERYVWPLLAVVLLLLFWDAAVRWSGTHVFPSPGKVQRGLLELLQKGLFFQYVGDSLFRVASGYLLAAGLGIPAGLLLGWYPSAAYTANPAIQMMRPISPLAWIPLAVIWFGTGDAAAIFLIFLSSFFPIVVSTMTGVRNVPPMYRQAGRNFGLTSAALLRRVILPAILPQILVGLRIALGVAWLVIVAAEMLAVTSGLGYLVLDSRNAGQRYDLVVAGMLLIGVVGLMMDILMRRLERWKSVRWGFRYET
ncbi:MAG TPA: ABC transporter permease [Terriglobia bacterium]|nr:ABC transporter permease [Terriglobia bacterium]